MTRVISGATCRDVAKALIDNYTPNAPFYVEVYNRDDLEITDMELIRDEQGACFLCVRVEDIKRD